jgi:hypothetical protein
MRPWLAASAVAFSVLTVGNHAESRDEFSLGKNVYNGGENVEIRFPAARKSVKGDQEWINITLASKPDSDWGVWKYVEDGARNMVLVAPKAPGKYEVRLFAHYGKPGAPANGTIIARQTVTIK